MMSKRFGRNQKRRLLAEISNRDQSLMLIRRRVDRQERELRRVAQVLDKNFIGFDPEEITHSGDPHRLRIAKIKKLGYPVLGMGSPEEMMPVYCNELEAGIMQTDKVDTIMDDCVHLRVHHPDTGTLGYAITKAALNAMPRRIFIETVSRELALQIWKVLNRT